jgi:hypothetical protein
MDAFIFSTHIFLFTLQDAFFLYILPYTHADYMEIQCIYMPKIIVSSLHSLFFYFPEISKEENKYS